MPALPHNKPPKASSQRSDIRKTAIFPLNITHCTQIATKELRDIG